MADPTFILVVGGLSFGLIGVTWKIRKYFANKSFCQVCKFNIKDCECRENES